MGNISENGADIASLFNLGLEIERVRITAAGELSAYDHPKVLGNPDTNPWLSNDFMMTQPEIVTGVSNDIDEVLMQLGALSWALRAAQPSGELIWPFSMPPRLHADRHELRFASVPPERAGYFEEMDRRYGVTEGLPSGVHINLSLNNDGVDSLTKNDVHLRIARGMWAYRWLFTYWFGASPVAETGYNDFAGAAFPSEPVRSIRASHEFGYGHANHVLADYTSVTAYADSLAKAVDDDRLMSEFAYHEAVRLRHPEGITGLRASGIDHIELRLFDNDPFERDGVSPLLLRAVQLLAAYFSTHDISPADMETAVHRNDEVALEHPSQQTRYHEVGLQLLVDIQIAFPALPETYLNTIATLVDWLEHPDHTISARLLSEIQDGSLMQFGLLRAEAEQKCANELVVANYDGFESDPDSAAGQLFEYFGNVI